MTNKYKSLIELYEEMEKQVDNTDIENAHYEGDMLLIDTLKTLSAGMVHEKLVKEIIDQYLKITKWYA